MSEPNRYVVTVRRFSGNTDGTRYTGTFRYYLWAYTAEDAKTQVNILGTDKPRLWDKIAIDRIEPYRKFGSFGDWEDNAVVEL
jgi:hypothetical protein